MNLFIYSILMLIIWFGSSVSACEYFCSRSNLTSSISPPLEYIEQAFDVILYDAELDFTEAPQSTEMSGVCKIHFFWRENPDTNKFYFHLYDLTIDSAFYGNLKYNPTKQLEPDGNYYYETTSFDSKAGDTVVLTIYYSGTMKNEGGATPWGGVSTDGANMFAIGVGFANSYVSSTRHWLPCYDHPSDKAEFRGKFKVKEGMMAVSNGEMTGVDKSGEFYVYSWEHKYPCSSYLLTFAVSDFIEVSFPAATQAIVYTPEVYEKKIEYIFKLLPKMIDVFAEKFGSYPFEKAGFVITPIGSMEHQTLVSYDVNLVNRYFNQNDTVNPVGAHELAHQWFGDLVTCRDFRDAWLNEGFATFCESIWSEALFGHQGYLNALTIFANRYINTFARMEGVFPLYDFPRTPPSSNYPGTIYLKGAMVIAMLRYELGDEVFFEAMREYLTRFAYGNASTELLRETLEDVSGKDLGTFFEQWVYGKGYPLIEIFATKIPNGDKFDYEVIFTQVQPSEYGIYKNVPIELEFRDYEGNNVYRIINLEGSSQKFYFPELPNISRILINNGPTIRSLVSLKSSEIKTSVEYTNVTSPIDVFPIPADNELLVRFDEMSDTFVIKIYDLNGVELKSYNNLDLLTSRKEYRLDISGFSQGLYILRIFNKTEIISKPFTILR